MKVFQDTSQILDSSASDPGPSPLVVTAPHSAPLGLVQGPGWSLSWVHSIAQSNPRPSPVPSLYTSPQDPGGRYIYDLLPNQDPQLTSPPQAQMGFSSVSSHDQSDLIPSSNPFFFKAQTGAPSACPLAESDLGLSPPLQTQPQVVACVLLPSLNLGPLCLCSASLGAPTGLGSGCFHVLLTLLLHDKHHGQATYERKSYLTWASRGIKVHQLLRTLPPHSEFFSAFGSSKLPAERLTQQGSCGLQS